jgi:tetratricopeptide (TPR) repeat protein
MHKTINFIIMKKLLVLMATFFVVFFAQSQTAQEYLFRGFAKHDFENYIGAIADYTKAIELNPIYAEAYHNRGLAKYGLEDYRGAIADLNKAIELGLSLMKYESYLFRGLAKHELKDYQGAIADYNKVIELHPGYRITYFYRGLVKIDLGQKDSGCMDLSKAGEMGHERAYEAIRELCN